MAQWCDPLTMKQGQLGERALILGHHLSVTKGFADSIIFFSISNIKIYKNKNYLEQRLQTTLHDYPHCHNIETGD